MINPIIDDLIAVIEADEKRIKELETVLKQHHEWHQQPDLEMKLGDEFFDCASSYVDSTLEEQTTTALHQHLENKS